MGVRTARVLIAALAVLAMMAPIACLSAPDNEPLYWGAYLGGGPPWDTARIDTFEAHAGKNMSIVHWGSPWSNGKLGGYREFQWAALETVRQHGSIPLLDWGSWELEDGLEQPRFTLDSVARGDHDAYIANWAHTAGAWQHPFFLRLNPEMNGWWLPWSEQTNGNQPGDFVKAWRHIVDIFRAQGANNVTWVWCPNVSNARTTPLAGLYPGDDYVDWTCMDGYNWGTDQGNEWQSFSQVFAGSAFNEFHNTYQELLDLAPSKPVMIGETATSSHGGDPVAWLSTALQSELPRDFPRVKAVVWFNYDDGDPTLSWPIESSPDVQKTFSVGINSERFAANAFAQLDVAPIPPADPLP